MDSRNITSNITSLFSNLTGVNVNSSMTGALINSTANNTLAELKTPALIIMSIVCFGGLILAACCLEKCWVNVSSMNRRNRTAAGAIAEYSAVANPNDTNETRSLTRSA